MSWNAPWWTATIWKRSPAPWRPSARSAVLRDANCVRKSLCVALVGTREKAQGLNCGHCGFATCGERTPGVPCEVNSVDVGIALGAAVSRAQAFGVDTRIMFSAGLAAQQLDLLGEGVGQVYAIPVSISSKSPFFDRG